MSEHEEDTSSTPRTGIPWTDDEHARYLQALAFRPRRSWKEIAEFIGTRTDRQVLCHHQKHQEKLRRHARGLKSPGRPPGRAIERPPNVTQLALASIAPVPLTSDSSERLTEDELEFLKSL